MRGLALGLALLTAACAPTVEVAGSPMDGAPDTDECRAASLQYLVDRDREQIPPPRPGQARRVYSTTDAVTMDYSAARLNIVWDANSGRIVRVFCG